MFPEELEANLLSSGTVEVPATCLYKPPAFVSIQISSNATKVVGALSWKYTLFDVPIASSTFDVANAVVAS